MTTTPEDTTLPRISVAGREFPIGPVTIHQVFRLKNVVLDLVRTMQLRQIKREQIVATTIRREFEHPDPIGLREQVAARLGVSVEDLDDAQYQVNIFQVISERSQEIRAEQGEVGDGAIVQLMDMLEGMSEDQIAQIATLLLDRYTHSRVTKEFILAHFELGWFIESLTLFLETNNVMDLAKKLQRLMTVGSMHLNSYSTANQTN